MMMRLLGVLAFGLSVTLLGTYDGAGARAGTPLATAGDLAVALQRTYDGVKDFSADFVQTYRGGVLRREVTERGRVEIKKPGKMRWEYVSPERKVFISDGEKVYYYIPADRQVMLTPAPQGDEPAAPAHFLAGKGNLTRDFTASLVEPPSGFPDGSRALKLAPKSPQPEYDWLTLVVDPRTLALRGLVSVDPQGGTSTFLFSNLKENVGIPDRTFDFAIPRGVQIITDGPRR